MRSWMTLLLRFNFFVQFRKEWFIVSQGSFTWFAPVCWFVPVGLASKSVTQFASWAIIRGSYAYSDVIGSRLAPFLHGLHALLGKRHLYRAQRFITCDWQIPRCQVRLSRKFWHRSCFRIKSSVIKKWRFGGHRSPLNVIIASSQELQLSEMEEN